jgi:hypothetical protein
MTGYKGRVKIQGTLDNDPGSSGNYADILEKEYEGDTDLDYINFNGVFTYIRVVHIPDRGPGDPNNDNPQYYGSFDKLLYRS